MTDSLTQGALNQVKLKCSFFLYCFSRPSGVRMKAPTVKEVLDIDKDNMPDNPELLRITAPPLHIPSRLVFP